MSLVAIVQARLGSTRFPDKVLQPIVGYPMLWHVVDRMRHAPGVERVVIATTDRPTDDPIRAFGQRHRIPIFSGSERDVLERYFLAALAFDADPILRITADCPLADPGVVERLIALYRSGNFDHVGVATGAGALRQSGGRFPDGLDAECFGRAALERAHREATEPSDREHVTPYLWRTGLFRVGRLLSDVDHSALRWTVDHEEDLAVVRRIYEALYRPDCPFSMEEVLRFLSTRPEIMAQNRAWVGQENYERVWSPALVRQ